MAESFRTGLCYWLVVLFALYIVVIGNVSEEIKALPDCTSQDASLDSFVFVSTIDGRVAALNGNDGGSEVWSVETGPGPMLSSSIHNLELARDGHFLRMIPSLSGGLYRFNGENVEVIPFTADDLLQASFRYKEDLVLTGGKESRTYGVDARTGTVLYECSLKGCENFTADAADVPDVMLLKRQTHTVRAVEPRTSFERWNFSVARHDLRLLPDPAALCHGSKQSNPITYDIRVIVPDGLVCAISRSDSSQILWKHKFDSPVVSAWTLEKGEMKELDLFSGAQWSPHAAHAHSDGIPLSPSLYIGMHKKQLYIQESVQMQRQLRDSAHHQNLITDESSYSRIPWRPVPAVPSNTLGLISHDSDDFQVPQITDESDDSEESIKKAANQAVRTTAMSVLYASEYVNGNGFYLYSSEALKKARRSQCGLIDNGVETLEGSNVSSDSSVEDQIREPERVPAAKPTPDVTKIDDDNYIIVSLWHWWKEVLLISATTAVLLNCAIMRVGRPPTTPHEEKRLLPLTHVPGSEIPPLEKFQLETTPLGSEYNSRYLQEFQPVQCLGKGGFGIVFEARKKFDDCLYAVKRIPLTNKKDSRERVLREVRALAKLDHNNIVRYFNSWLECPPPGWQEEQDKQWAKVIPSSGSVYNPAYSELSGYSDETSTSHQPVTRNVVRKKKPDFRENGPNDDDHSNSVLLKQSKTWEESGRFSKDDISDSYIVFGDSAGGGHESDDENEDSREGRKESVISVYSSSSSSEASVKREYAKQMRPNNLSVTSNSPNTTVSYLFIQMQLCRKDSLKEWLRCNPKRDYASVLTFFEQIVMAVEYVHLSNLIHRDLKPSNIFFSMDGHIKIGDFGLVTTMLEGAEEQRTPVEGPTSSTDSAERHTAQVGTELYMSPEQRMGRPYNYKVDIYSLGLILFELLVPFGTEMERIRTMQELHHHKFPEDFQDHYQQEYQLLRMMLDHHPEKRPTTFGIRARPPLRHRQAEDVLSDLAEEHHFELPSRQRSSSSFTKLSSSSTSSMEYSSNIPT